MGLFGTKKKQSKEVTIQECIKMIEGFFKKINLSAKDRRLPNQDSFGWWVQRGSALVYILLNEEDETVRIISPILYLPEKNILPFYRKCLEMNTSLINCAFGAMDDKIVLVSERPINGLDPQELEGTIQYLSAVADDIDDKLAIEFKAQMYLEGSGSGL